MFALLFSLAASQVKLGLTDERKFLNWMRENNLFYTGDEYNFRLGLFISHARWVQEFNRQSGLTFQVTINKFSCYTPAEYKAILGGLPKNTVQRPGISKAKGDVPDSFDWRTKNVVNPIKDQAACGSCWAFSSIATSETAYALTSGKLLSFSEQNLVDCAPCYGCSGGWSDAACEYVISNQKGQFNSETDYPYTAVDGTCSFDASKGIGEIKQLINVARTNEEDLKEKVATYGVASISISAGNTPFMSYKSGILDDSECQGAFIDHAVACVGYGSEDGIDYWIVRNSWGTSWGEEGYVRMIRNKNNQCSVATQAFVAVD